MENGLSANNNRLDYIDIARAIGLILVIISHSVCPQYMFFSYQFFIPLFFILTGYTFTKFSIQKKVIRLLVPYSIFNILIIGLMWVSGIKEISMENIVGVLYSRYSIYPDKIILMNIGNSPTWFLTAMFVSFCLLYPLIKYPQYNVITIIVYFAITYILTLCPILLPWSIDTAFILSIFIYIGILIKRSNILHLKWYMYIIALALYTITAILNGDTNISIREYGSSVILLLIGGTIGSILTIKLSMLVEDCFINQMLVGIGRNSLVIFCIQFPFLFIIEKACVFIGIENGLIITTMQLVFTLVAGYYTSKLLHIVFPKIF